jgi:hypothetical protein
MIHTVGATSCRRNEVETVVGREREQTNVSHTCATQLAKLALDSMATAKNGVQRRRWSRALARRETSELDAKQRERELERLTLLRTRADFKVAVDGDTCDAMPS